MIEVEQLYLIARRLKRKRMTPSIHSEGHKFVTPIWHMRPTDPDNTLITLIIY